MTGAITPPMALAAATAEPEMAPKSIEASTFTWARPPGSVPRIDLARSINRRAMPPRFMIWPARMKNGIASSVKLSSPVAIRWATVVTAGPGRMLSSMASSVDSPML